VDFLAFVSGHSTPRSQGILNDLVIVLVVGKVPGIKHRRPKRSLMEEIGFWEITNDLY
jgi:hypothetical protein